MYLLLSYCFYNCNAQKPFGTEHLQLQKVIELPDVKGRIDHMAINLKDQSVYVAALGNNSVEVVDINKGIHLKSITGVDEPQGVCYISETNELVIANGGNGKCIFYDGSTYEINATVDLKNDADNVRFDPIAQKIYVGYGNGGIAVIDAVSHLQIGNVKLPVHPESFQVDNKNNLLIVNLPGDKSIGVIDTKSLKLVNNWKTTLRSNFPMTLDTSSNTVIIGYRNPAFIVSYDVKTGNEQARSPLVSDVDDVFFYKQKKEIFASGGGGSINIFRKENTNEYELMANIPTRSGARTSLLIPSLQMLILAERAGGGKPASLAVYKIVD